MKSLALVCLLPWLSAILSSEASNAAVFNVPNGDVAALKNAIGIANTNAEDDIIELASNGTYILTTIDNSNADTGSNGFPVIGSDGGKKLTIRGNGATIQPSSDSGTPKFRIFYIGIGADVTIASLTISNVDILAGGCGSAGGAMYNDAILTINSCVLSNNRADLGGAIVNSGSSGSATLTVNNSTFISNSGILSVLGGCGWGGAIVNSRLGQLTIVSSSFSNNTAQLGGAIYNEGVADISQSSFDTNSAIGQDQVISGGAIRNHGNTVIATLTVTTSTFTGNSSDGSRGAISNISADGGTATLSVGRCKFNNNSAASSAGAIGSSSITRNGHPPSTASLTISDSTFANNTAESSAAISSSYGTNCSAGITVANSTFSGNYANFDGAGAIDVQSHPSMPQVITNSTFAGNIAEDSGGAIGVYGYLSGALASVTNCTLIGNSAPSGGAIYVFGSNGTQTLFLENTILKTGTSGQNIYNVGGTVTSGGYNLSNDDGSGFLNGPADQVNTDPMLDPAGLQNNGGPTGTVGLLPGSPAINTGDPNAPQRDQRYYLRNGAPDKGAFEYRGRSKPPPTPTPGITPTPSPRPSTSPKPTSTPGLTPTPTPRPSSTPK